MLLSVTTGRIFAGTPPPGFQETVLVPSVFQITGFDWAPNGDLWIISKPGLVRILRPGDTAPTIVANLQANTDAERGLAGIAIDPGYSANRFIYLYYTAPTTPARNRVSRFTSVGDSLQDETILLEGPDLVSGLHNAGHMQFGPDGMLYVAMGDNAQELPAQDTSSLLGKILRIAPDGSIPSGNPFADDPNARPEVWAYGFRNPFRFAIQPATGTLFIGDVGQETWEELSLGLAGSNYGWPQVEGPEPPGVPGVTYPIFSYNHLGTGASIVAGDFMRAGNFPAEYEGDFFYADFTLWKVFRLKLDASAQVVLNEEFVTTAVAPVHVRVGPDGALYYASIQFQSINRVAFVGGTNRVPQAAASAGPQSGPAPLGVQFDSTGSFDPDGDPLTYDWDFGDGFAASGPAPFHTYASPGVFTARLDADDSRAIGSDTVRIVSGNNAPAATIQAPADGAFFNAGDTIGFTGSAVDPEDGPLAPAALSWTVLFHHNTHAHPYLGPLSGTASGSFFADDAGETATDVWYEIRLTATDSGAPIGPAGAVTSTHTIAVHPNLSTLTFVTAPHPALTLSLDGAAFQAPRSVTGVVGVKRVIGATSPQSPGDGRTYTFSGWSDSGAVQHTIVTPALDGTLTAGFSCNVLDPVANLEVALEPGGDVTLSWDASGDPCLSTDAPVYRIYAGAIATPALPPGAFPADPPFAPAGETAGTSITLTPSVDTEFYMVVPIGSDDSEGPAGHYGG